MDLSSFLFINLTAAVSWMVVFCNTDCHLEREGKCAHDVTQAQMLADAVCYVWLVLFTLRFITFASFFPHSLTLPRKLW